MASGEQDMVFDSEGDQNSADSFEKQLQQQEIELQNQLREVEEARKNAVEMAEAPANDTSAPWKDNSEPMEETVNGNNGLDQDTVEGGGDDDGSAGLKRSSEDDPEGGKDTDSPPSKKGKVDELAKLWAAINENPKDFQAWTNILQYVDQQSELEGGREAYTAFFARYPYCYGYWKKFADLEKRKGTRETTLEVFEKGLLAIPLSVDLWVHYLDYVINTYTSDEEERFVRQQFERAVQSCGLEFRSDKMWDAYINWESNNKRYQRVTAVYDKLLATPVAKYLQHWAKFQEHIKKHPITEVISVEEFLSHRRTLAKSSSEEEAEASEEVTEEEAPPGAEEDLSNQDVASSETPASAAVTDVNEEECKNIQQLVLSSREKLHHATGEEVKLRWGYEDAIKRPYFHVKSLERSQLAAWREYLEFEMKQGTEQRCRTLFERCLIAAALYEEFWMRYIHYLETLKSVTPDEMRNVYERACNIHLKEKMKPHLSWAMFEEESGKIDRALELLKDLQTRMPEALEPWTQQAAIERRRGRLDIAAHVFEEALHHYRDKDGNMLTLPHANLLVKYSRFMTLFLKDNESSIKLLQGVLDEKIASSDEVKLTGEEQRGLEMMLWALVDKFLASSPPNISKAMETLKLGTQDIFAPNSRLAFAHRRYQFVLECGSSEHSVIELGKQLRELQQELKQQIQDDMNTSDKGDRGDLQGEGRKDKKSKGDKNSGSNNQQQSQTNNQQNGGYYGGGQNYGATQGGAPYYPPSNPPPHQPPQHPPPQQGGQQNYGGYNQNYSQGGYPPQQYQGWGYPQPQGNYGYNQQQQQQWSGYQNYYGQR